MTDDTRRPSIVVCLLGEWVEEFERFAVDNEFLVVWIEELSASVEEGAAVSLSYFGPTVGDTANTTGTVAIVEVAHGGFHVGIEPESVGFLDAVTP